MTLDELIARRAAYLAAETAVLQAQSYKIGDGSAARTWTGADLSEIRAEIVNLNRQIQAAQDEAAGVGGLMYLTAR